MLLAFPVVLVVFLVGHWLAAVAPVRSPFRQPSLWTASVSWVFVVDGLAFVVASVVLRRRASTTG